MNTLYLPPILAVSCWNFQCIKICSTTKPLHYMGVFFFFSRERTLSSRTHSRGQVLRHWQKLFHLQSDSNGMFWPGCGQTKLCPKVLTVADELINVNLCNLHTGSSAQLLNGLIPKRGQQLTFRTSWKVTKLYVPKRMY